METVELELDENWWKLELDGIVYEDVISIAI